MGPPDANVWVEPLCRLHPVTEFPASEANSSDNDPKSSEFISLPWERDNKQTCRMRDGRKCSEEKTLKVKENMKEGILYGWLGKVSDRWYLSKDLKNERRELECPRHRQGLWCPLGLAYSRRSEGQRAQSRVNKARESGSNETRDMVRAQGMEDPAGPGEDGRWEATEGF